LDFNNFSSNGCNGGQEILVYIDRHSSYKYQNWPGNSQNLQALAAILQDALTQPKIYIGVIEVVEKVENKDRVGLYRCLLQLVSKLETGRGPSQDGMFQDFGYGRGMPANSTAQAVLVREPFSTHDKVERAAQGKADDEFS
jgi:hypothetical protein